MAGASISSCRRRAGDPGRRLRQAIHGRPGDDRGWALVIKGKGRIATIDFHNNPAYSSKHTPEQRAAFDQTADEEAEVYGLPRCPALGYLLARLLAVSDFSTPAGLEGGNRIVDVFNPSPGLVKTATALAANDDRKVDFNALEKTQSNDSAVAVRE